MADPGSHSHVTAAHPSGRSRPPDPVERLRMVCRAAGLNPKPARLIKFTNNLVFELPAAGVVVRIVGSPALHYRVEKIIAVARWLEQHDFPAIRLHSDFDQPVAVGSELATIWVRAEPTGQPPDHADLGTLIRRFHSLPPPPDGVLPRFDPIGNIRHRLDHADGLGREDRRLLRSLCDEAEAQLAGIDFAESFGPIHGDAHIGNVIHSSAGPVLSDFDSTCIGPRTWDLVPVLLGPRRFGDPPEHVDQFLTAYGSNLPTRDQIDVLLRIRELQLVASVVPVLRSNPGVVGEFHRRLRSVRDDDDHTRWSRYR